MLIEITPAAHESTETGGFRTRLSASINRTLGQLQRLGIREDECGLVIDTDRFSAHPLYLRKRADAVLVSTNPSELLERSPPAGPGNDRLSIDRVGLAESLIFDHPLRERMLFNGWRKLLPGRQLTIDRESLAQTERIQFVLPFHRGEPIKPTETLLDEAVARIDALLRELPFDDEPYLIPLSGGLDSRLLACLAQRDGVPCRALTFGPRESIEPFIAKRIARRLALPIDFLELKDALYRPYGDEVTWMTAGLSSHMHCHLYAVMSAYGVGADHSLHGFMGDVFAGDSQPPQAAELDLSRDEAMARFLASRVYRSSIWHRLPADLQEAIRADLDQAMEECCSTNLPCHFEEYLHNVDRQVGLIAPVFLPVEQRTKLIRPFATEDYALFFNTLPYVLREDRKLFRMACERLFPRFFAAGTQRQFFSPMTLAGRAEAVLSPIWSKISLASVALTRGRLVIPDPKAYERSRELLYRLFEPELHQGIDQVSTILDVDLSDLRLDGPGALRQQFLGRKQLSPYLRSIAQFRCIAWNSLARQLRDHGIDLALV